MCAPTRAEIQTYVDAAFLAAQRAVTAERRAARRQADWAKRPSNQPHTTKAA